MADRAAFPLVVAAGALISPAGRVLVQQRPVGKQLAGLWEFPGGKLEPGETPESALVRELAEELGIGAAPHDVEPVAFASEPISGRHLLLLLFLVRRWVGEPRALEAAALRWARLDELATLPMPPADRPLVAALARVLAG